MILRTRRMMLRTRTMTQRSRRMTQRNRRMTLYPDTAEEATLTKNIKGRKGDIASPVKRFKFEKEYLLFIVLERVF